MTTSPDGSSDKLLDQLLKEAQEKHEKLTLTQVARLLRLLTMKTLLTVGGAMIGLVSAGFAIGVWYQDHFPSPSEASSKAMGSSVARQKPQGLPSVRAIPYQGQPDWYSDHSYWLEKEGDREKEVHMIVSYGLGESQYTATSDTIPFTLSLSVPEGYSIVSRQAFRVMNMSGKSWFERLVPESSDGTLRELRLSVPECRKDEKIQVIFRVDSRMAGASMVIEDVVKTRID